MSTKKITVWVAVMLSVCFIMVILLPTYASELIAASISGYDYTSKVFVKNKVTDVHIEIDDEDWQDLLENPLQETYYTATVTVGGTTVYNAAIRTKGNTSLSQVAMSDSDRYSFKIDFAQYDDTQTLYGLQKLNLNNNMSDTSSMKEYLSYELMEEMGIPTPAHSYMYVYINGEEYGLYLGVEQIDETFLASNYSDSSGDLYKPESTSLEWDGDDIDNYKNLYLKTNEDTSDQSAMANFLDVINNGGDLSSVMDIDEVIRYFAVNTALVNLDSYQGSTRHNYYLYEEDGVFSIIPWDYNMSFGGFGIGMGGGGFGGEMPDMGDFNGEMPDWSDGQILDFGNGEIPDFDGEMPSFDGQMPGGSENDGSHNITGGAEVSEMSVTTTANGNMGGGPGGGMGGQGGGKMPDMNNGEFPDMGDFDGEMPSFGDGEMPDFDGQMPDMDDFNGQMPSFGEDNENAQGGFGGPGGGMGSNFMANGNIVNQSAIDFTIDTPVSGVSLENSPLIYSWITDDEYLELYHSYLEEIANGFLSESRMTVMVGELTKLISSYVERDPTAFYTFDQFESAVSSDDSLIEFAKQRSESILQQLSGEKESTSDTSAQVTMDAGNARNSEEGSTDAYDDAIFGGNFQPPDGDGDAVNNIQGDENFSPPNMDGENAPTNNGEGGPAGMGGMMGLPGRGENADTGSSINSSTVLAVGISLTLLLIAIGFTVFFQRRGWKRKMSFHPMAV